MKLLVLMALGVLLAGVAAKKKKGKQEEFDPASVKPKNFDATIYC